MKRAIFRSDKSDWFQNHSLASFSFRFCRAKTIAAPIRSRSSGVFATQLEIEPSAVFLKCNPTPVSTADTKRRGWRLCAP